MLRGEKLKLGLGKVLHPRQGGAKPLKKIRHHGEPYQAHLNTHIIANSKKMSIHIAQNQQSFFEITWKLSFQVNLFTIFGNKPKASGMQKLPFKPSWTAIFFAPIEFVTRDRIADACQMRANLMRATCFGRYLQ